MADSGVQALIEAQKRFDDFLRQMMGGPWDPREPAPGTSYTGNPLINWGGPSMPTHLMPTGQYPTLGPPPPGDRPPSGRARLFHWARPLNLGPWNPPQGQRITATPLNVANTILNAIPDVFNSPPPAAPQLTPVTPAVVARGGTPGDVNNAPQATHVGEPREPPPDYVPPPYVPPPPPPVLPPPVLKDYKGNVLPPGKGVSGGGGGAGYKRQ